jgi:hypothetical protein
MGTTEAARRAGRAQARTAAAVSRVMLAAHIHGSRGFTP